MLSYSIGSSCHLLCGSKIKFVSPPTCWYRGETDHGEATWEQAENLPGPTMAWHSASRPASMPPREWTPDPRRRHLHVISGCLTGWSIMSYRWEMLSDIYIYIYCCLAELVLCGFALCPCAPCCQKTKAVASTVVNLHEKYQSSPLSSHTPTNERLQYVYRWCRGLRIETSLRASSRLGICIKPPSQK